MWDKYILIKGGAVVITTIIFTTTFIILILYGVDSRSSEFDCCNVTNQNNHSVSFEWPYPPYYNATVHFDHSELISQIKCGYSNEDINGTFGAWRQGECLGNSCNINNPYSIPLLILTGITAISIIVTIITCIQINESQAGYNRLS